MSDHHLSGRAKLAGVMGWPVAHSRSPLVHGTWLKRHGIDGAYVPLAVAPEDLKDAVKGLKAAGFRGFNVTVPHKQAVMALMDELDTTATRLGAVNTVVIGEKGRLIGRNTDGFGFIENLRAGRPDLGFGGMTATVLGAGGAARSVIASLQDAGCTKICLVNRTIAKAEALAADIGGTIEVFGWDQAPKALEKAGLLVNCTSLGMEGQKELNLDLAALQKDAVVTDIVYAPLMTGVLRAAQQRGNPIVDGLGMLLHQARPGFAAWFGVDPTVDDELRQIVLDDLKGE